MSKINLIQRLEKYKDGEMDYYEHGDYCRFDEVEEIIIELEQKNKQLEQEKAEMIEILKPIKEIIDMYELYNELTIELIYDKLSDILKINS